MSDIVSNKMYIFCFSFKKYHENSKTLIFKQNMWDPKNAEMANYSPKWGLQIFSRTFIDKMYILCFDFKYWKLKIPFFNQNMWNTE